MKRNPSGCLWGFLGTALVLLLSAGFVYTVQNAQSAQQMEVDISNPLEILIAPTSTMPPTATDVSPTATLTATATETPIPPPTVTSTATPLPQVEGPTAIGLSVEGRPIEAYRFGTGDLAYLVVGGIHGGYEVNTVHLTDELIAYFITHPDEIPPETRLYIVRALNVDGLQKPYDADGRANANKVDLNRNYPTDWAVDWERTGCWNYREINAGTHAASEPETIAMMAFIINHPLVAMVSFHAAAPGFYPSGKPHHEDSAALSTYLSEASGYPYPAVDIGCQMTGNLVDWAHTLGVAGADVELTDHYNTEFETNLKLVKALLTWRP